MGWFSPKYPQSDTPGATGTPAKKESRADRKVREFKERLDTDMEESFKNARRVSKERSARFWDDQERKNGKGSVDWS